ncbi:PIG-L family deacetylase [Croceicoccus hydrothermalis]|uniref:PIG-L deacetylase family protein n=1 Tax=Croceicoccus hydrothermalis TaxID=2867964 RepID=UPI00308468F4
MSLPDAVAGTVLSKAQAAPFIAIEELAPGPCLLLVVPHPDDETLGCGMALAAAAARGTRIVIVLLTDGEASHPSSVRFDRDALARVRRRELSQALAHLCPGKSVTVHRLGLPDGTSRPSDIGPHTMERVVTLAAAAGASAIWTTWAGDPHCDHQTAAALCRHVALRLGVPHFAFPVWGRFGKSHPPAHLFRFHDTRFLDCKHAAVACYRSQTGELIADDPGGFIMPPAFLDHFANHSEIFIREYPE